MPIFTITDTKLYVPVETLSTQYNAKLLEQLKSGFKRTTNCNKYQAKISIERQHQFLSHILCGFRKAHSAQHALFKLLQSWQKELDNGGFEGTILMDLP